MLIASNRNGKRSIRHLVSPTRDHIIYGYFFSYKTSLFSVRYFFLIISMTLNNVDEEFDDTEHALTEWSDSYTSGRPSNFSGTKTFANSYTGTYTGSPSFLSLPTFSPRSPFPQIVDSLACLSRITEVTEECRPTSIATSATNVLILLFLFQDA